MATERNDRGNNPGNYFGEMQSHPNTLSEQLLLDALHGKLGRMISFTMIALMAVTTILSVTIFSIVEAIVPSLAEVRIGSERKRDGEV